jgi:hypothetical protein
MARERYKLDLKTGKMVRVEGKGSSAEEASLRGLPSELTTKDRSDPTKIHALDPMSVREQIVRDRGKELTQAKHDKPALEHRPLPLTQERVDHIRARVWRVTVDKAKRKMAAHQPIDLTVGHLWFPTDNIQVYEYRKGNPPSPSDRPKHMKHLRLEIDPTGFCPLPEKLLKKARKKAIKNGGSWRTLPAGVRNFAAEMYEVVDPRAKGSHIITLGDE